MSLEPRPRHEMARDLLYGAMSIEEGSYLMRKKQMNGRTFFDAFGNDAIRFALLILASRGLSVRRDESGDLLVVDPWVTSREGSG